MLGRNKYVDKEYDLSDKLKRENEKLQRELGTVRKMLDRYAVAEKKGLIDEEIITPGKKRHKEDELKELWKCYDCGIGFLRLKGPYANRYWRTCDHCGKRTKTQLWNKEVGGLR